jgi:hypothetical protein
MNTKTIIASLTTSAVLASSTATLETDFLTAEDYKYLQFVTEQGRSYATKAEF